MKLQALLLTSALSSLALNTFAEGGYMDVYNESYDSGTAITLAMSDMVVGKANTSIGEVFTTSKGLTLYTFTKDTPSISNCNGGCATSWPPFTAKKSADTWGEFTVIERADGSYQWAYKNQPLYTWVGDQKEGDVNGQGVGSVWYAAETAK